MNQPVGEITVKSSYQEITTPEQLEIIWPGIKQKVSEIEGVLPTISTIDSYNYIDATTALKSTIRAYEDAKAGHIAVKDFLRFLRRLLIVSGTCMDDGEFHSLIIEEYEITMYTKVNEDEI